MYFVKVSKDYIPVSTLEEGMLLVCNNGGIMLTELERFLDENPVWKTYFPLYQKRLCQYDEESYMDEMKGA